MFIAVNTVPTAMAFSLLCPSADKIPTRQQTVSQPIISLQLIFLMKPQIFDFNYL